MLPFIPATLAFDEFPKIKDEIQQLTRQFQDYISENTSLLHQAKPQHNSVIRDLAQQKRSLEEEKNLLLQKINLRTDSVNEHFVSLEHKHSKVEGLAQDYEDLMQTKESLQKQVEETEMDICKLERSADKIHESVNTKSMKDIEELDRYELYTGLKVEAVAEDHLRFRFSNINPNGIGEAAYCQLFVGGEFYQIVESYPPLGAEQTSTIEEDLNKNGEIMLFLKQIRNGLKDASRNL